MEGDGLMDPNCRHPNVRKTLQMDDRINRMYYSCYCPDCGSNWREYV